MGKISLSNMAGKVFWASLFGYCAVFTVFYFNTQYSLGKLDNEMRNGNMFETLRHTACEQTKGCVEINFLPYLVLNESTGKYKVQASVKVKHPKDINREMINQMLDAQRANLPWYVNNKLDSIEVAIVNGNKIVPEKSKPDWYLSLIS
jgi:hypothetical protein